MRKPMTEHITDVNWPDSVKTVSVSEYDEDTHIHIHYLENLMRSGGYYSVWEQNECVFEGSFDRAKQHAIRAHERTGNPIVETVMEA